MPPVLRLPPQFPLLVLGLLLERMRWCLVQSMRSETQFADRLRTEFKLHLLNLALAPASSLSSQNDPPTFLQVHCQNRFFINQSHAPHCTSIPTQCMSIPSTACHQVL